jgi:hypothetical protein
LVIEAPVRMAKEFLTVRLLDSFDFAHDAIECGIPLHRNEAQTFYTFKRTLQTIRMFVLHVALDAFGTELSSIEREIFPGLQANNLVRPHAELNAPLLAAEATVRFHELVVLAGIRPASGGNAA